MKTGRVCTIFTFLDIKKKIDGLWKKPPYAHSSVCQGSSHLLVYIILLKRQKRKVQGHTALFFALWNVLKLSLADFVS